MASSLRRPATGTASRALRLATLHLATLRLATSTLATFTLATFTLVTVTLLGGPPASADPSPALAISAAPSAADFPPPTQGGTLPTILGRALDASGNPVAGLTLTLSYTDHDHPAPTSDGTAATTTAADGSFGFQPAQPTPSAVDGQYQSRTFTVSHPAGDAGFPAATSSALHIGIPGSFDALVNSGAYATPRNPYWAISGQVSGPAGSVVLGQIQTATGWQTVSQTTSYPVAGTTGVNRFSLAFPGLRDGAQTVRAARPSDDFQDEADSTPVTVRYDWGHLAGNPARFSFAYTTVAKTPVRYSPCSPVTWAINLDGAPAGALRLVQQAFVQAGHYSGYHFRFLGTTRERPSAHDADVRAATQRGPAILVKWVRANGETDLAKHLKNIAGVGGSTLQHTPDGRFRLGGGTLLLVQKPGGQDLPMDFGPLSWGPEVLHEIGSVVGLSYVPDRNQIMFRKAGAATRYGAGDAAGLGRLGRAPGCATS